MRDEQILAFIIKALGTSRLEIRQNLGHEEQIRALFRHRLERPQTVVKPNKELTP